MKYVIIMASALLMQGCTFNVAWRGTLTNVEQKAETDGRVASTPTARDTSIAAEKTTDAKLDVPLVK